LSTTATTFRSRLRTKTTVTSKFIQFTFAGKSRDDNQKNKTGAHKQMVSDDPQLKQFLARLQQLSGGSQVPSGASLARPSAPTPTGTGPGGDPFKMLAGDMPNMQNPLQPPKSAPSMNNPLPNMGGQK